MLILYIIYWLAPTLIILISYSLIMVTFKKSSSNLKEVSDEKSHQVVKSSSSLFLEPTSSLVDSMGKQSEREYGSAIANCSSLPTSSTAMLVYKTQGKKIQLQDGDIGSDESPSKSPLKTRRLSVSVIDLDQIQLEQNSKKHRQQKEHRYQLIQQRIDRELLREMSNGFRMKTFERVASRTFMFLTANQAKLPSSFHSSQMSPQKWRTNNSSGNNGKSNDPTKTIENSFKFLPTNFATNTTATAVLGAHRKFSQILRGSLRVAAHQMHQQQSSSEAPRRKTFEELHTSSDDHRLMISVPKFSSNDRFSIRNSLQINQAANSQITRTMLQFRLARMSFYLILLWLISWTPIAFLVMINSVFTCYQASATGVFMANTMTKLGPAFDVFIYGVSHPKIKSKFKEIIKRLFTIKTCLGKSSNSL